MTDIGAITVQNQREIDHALAQVPDWARRDLAVALRSYAGGVIKSSRSRGSSRLLKLALRSLSEASTPGGVTITAGGNTQLPNGNGTYGDVFFGAEFGGGSRAQTRQFRPYRSTGYAFWPSVWATRDRDRLVQVLDEVVRQWEA